MVVAGSWRGLSLDAWGRSVLFSISTSPISMNAGLFRIASVLARTVSPIPYSQRKNSAILRVE